MPRGIRKPKPSGLDGELAEAEAAAQPDPKPDEKPKAQRAGPKAKLDDIAALIALPNSLLLALPAFEPDALSPEEHAALAEALYNYQDRSTRMRKLLNAGIQSSALGALVLVCTVIAIPRLARHGLLPAQLAERLERIARQRGMPSADTRPEGSPPEAPRAAPSAAPGSPDYDRPIYVIPNEPTGA